MTLLGAEQIGYVSCDFEVAVCKQNSSCVHSKIILDCGVADGTSMKLLQLPEPEVKWSPAAWSCQLAVLKPQCVMLSQVPSQECWLKVLLMEIFSIENDYLTKTFSVECINFLFFQQEIYLAVSFLWVCKFYFDFTVLYLNREVKTAITS